MSKKKPTTEKRKLTIKRETLRKLDDKQLQQAAGGLRVRNTDTDTGTSICPTC